MPSNPTPLRGGNLLRLATAILLLTPSTLLANAQESEEEGPPPLYTEESFSGLSRGGTRDAPYGIPLTEWDDRLDNSPNATGSIELPIPDLTKKFNQTDLTISRHSNDASSGWNWTIELADGLPATMPNTQDERGLTTGVRLRLNAPEEVFTGDGMDDSWQICVITWKLKEGLSTNSSTFAKMRSSDDCSGSLSEQCIRDIEGFATSGPDAYGRCQCPDPHTIDSCKGHQFPNWSVCINRPYYAAEVRGWKNGILPIESYAGIPRPEDEEDDDLLAYNTTGQIVWPVMITWGRGIVDSRDDDDDDTSSLTSTATVTRSATSLTSLTSIATSTSVSTSVETETETATSTERLLGTATGTGGGIVTPTSSESTPGDNFVGEKVKIKVKRQNSNDDDDDDKYRGSRYSAGKLSCLAVKQAEDGSVLPGPVVRTANAAVGKFGVMPSSLVVVVSGLVGLFLL